MVESHEAGQNGEGTPDKDIWFIYRQVPGRFTAQPVTAAGWVSFIGAILGGILIAYLSGPTLQRIHPALFAVSLFAIILLTVFGLRKLIIRKGRRA